MVRLSDILSPVSLSICGQAFSVGFHSPPVLWLQILLPFLMFLQLRQMDIKRRIGDMDLPGESQHRYDQQTDGAKKQHVGKSVFIEIDGDHGCQRQQKGHRTGL